MDYTERQDFNNPFVVIFGLGALLLSISGCVMLFSSFSRHDFRLFTQRKHTPDELLVTLLEPMPTEVREVTLRRGVSLFDGLAANGIQLPSNCGGGGVCGLCQVLLPPGAPVSRQERSVLSSAALKAGIRLACQQRTSATTDLTLDTATP